MISYADLIYNYGNLYLMEESPDDVLYDMDELLDPSILKTVQKSFYGGRYGKEKEAFNPNDEFFYIDGSGSFISVHENNKVDYLLDLIGWDNEDFLEWSRKNYPDDFKDLD